MSDQVVGDGALDLLLIDTWVHHVEAVWDFPEFARFLRRLSSFGRLIHFDRRGTGLSDPVPLQQLPDLQTQVGDAVAVLKAAGSDGAAVIGLNDGTIVAVLLAAAHPKLCRSLALFTLTSAHTLAAGMPMESIDQAIDLIATNAVTDDSGVEWLAPSRVGDERFDRQLARLQRFSVRPGAFGHYYRQTMEADVAGVLPLIRTPTLVLNRTGNPIVPVEQSRVAAAAIQGARFVELPGTDHLAFSEGIDGLLDEVEEFLTGTRTGADPDRMLTTLLFTDIVSSTTLAAQLGDRRWRDVLDQHHELGGGELARFGGREVATTGDGFFAAFDRPIAAVRCALAMVEAMPSLRLQIRAGVHTGEVEVRGADLGGLAVHIAAGSRRWPATARYWSPAPSRTCSPVPASASTTDKTMSSKAFPERGGCSRRGPPDRSGAASAGCAVPAAVSQDPGPAYGGDAGYQLRKLVLWAMRSWRPSSKRSSCGPILAVVVLRVPVRSAAGTEGRRRAV